MREKEIMHFLIYLQSQRTAQHYLRNCYKEMEGIDAEKKSYKNSGAFMYYLEHGLKFYESGKGMDQHIRPILYFYGMVHLLKACLLAKRPDYPETTTVLAHGVSTRKRKKQNYTFMNDEVKIQHNGLFPYFTRHLFAMKSFPYEKVPMHYLFAFIPEMNTFFQLHKQEKLVKVGSIGSTNLHFPEKLLDSYFLTANTFLQRIAPCLPKIIHKEITHSILIELEKPLENSYAPFLFHVTDQSIYFPIKRSYFVLLPEAVAHYMLLYNLSMLSRYEPEWWGELLSTKPDIDYPFISQFLAITPKKVPLLLGNELYKNFS